MVYVYLMYIPEWPFSWLMVIVSLVCVALTVLYNIKEAYYYTCIMNYLKISKLTSLLISKLRSEPEILFPMREKTL